MEAEAQAAAQAQAEAEAQAAAQAQAEAEAQAAAQAQAEAEAQAAAQAQTEAEVQAAEEAQATGEEPSGDKESEAEAQAASKEADPAGDKKSETTGDKAAEAPATPAARIAAVETAAPAEAPKVEAPAIADKDEIEELVSVRDLLTAFVLNGAAPFDNSTTLPDGTYTPDDYKFEGGTGKARYDCESVTVSGGKATAVLISSSANMTHIALTHTEASAEDATLYDPATGTLGTDVYAIANKRVEIPVVVNKSMEVAGRTTAMGNPHWVNYTITITVNEPEESDPVDEDDFDNSTDLADGTYIPSDYTFTGGTGKARYDCEKVIVKNGRATAVMVSSSASATHVSLKHTEEASEDTAFYDPATGETGKNVFALSDKKVEIPVKLNSDMPIASRTTAMGNPHWINYTIHITVTEEDRLDEDVFYSVTVKAVDASTNKEISGAKITVTDADSNDVAAESGVYTLTGGATYTVKAAADGYEAASQSYTASKDETLTLNLKKKESSSEESGKTGNLKIVKNAAMFKVVSASLEGSGNNKKLRIALSGQGYQYLYKGSKEDAAVSKASERIKGKKNANGKWEFVIPVTSKDGTFALAALSSSKNAWYDRTIILDQKKMTLSTESADPATSIPVPDGEDWRGDSGKEKAAEAAKKKEQEAGYKDASNVGTSAVNNSTSLADGTYGPGDFSFSFSGGTGKVVIVCTQVVVRGGQAYATIKFQKPNGRPSSVDTVRAAGGTYGGNNVFEIPVQLNVNNTVVARTTAMSQPHWVEYKIFISMKEPGKDGSVGKDSKTMDDEAPEIAGLTVKDETEVVYSDRFKIFNYEDGIYLIEVDMISDTAREDLKEDEEEDNEDAAGDESTADNDTDSEADAADSAVNADADGQEELAGAEEASASGVSTAEEEAAPAVSEAAETAELYMHDIVKYLVVPADTEIPAGLSKEVIVIEQPAEKTYVSSAGALEMLDDLGVIGAVRTIGIEEKDVTVDSVLEALQPRDPDGVPLIAFAGTYDDWDLKDMIIKSTDFAVQSSAFLPKDEKTLDDDMENFERLTNRAAQMGFACFVDRSEDEENDLARAEWYKVYGIIFDELDKGEAAYKEVVDAASASEKKAALDLLEKRAAERKAKIGDEAGDEAEAD